MTNLTLYGFVTHDTAVRAPSRKYAECSTLKTEISLKYPQLWAKSSKAFPRPFLFRRPNMTQRFHSTRFCSAAPTSALEMPTLCHFHADVIPPWTEPRGFSHRCQLGHWVLSHSLTAQATSFLFSLPLPSHPHNLQSPSPSEGAPKDSPSSRNEAHGPPCLPRSTVRGPVFLRNW